MLAPAGRLAISWWNTPDVSRLHGVFFEALAEVGAAPPDDLPPGPPIFRYSDDEALATLLAAAGLEVTPPATSTITHVLGGPTSFGGALNSMVRLAALIRGQPEAIQDQIARRSSAACTYVEPAGVRIPVSFKIASGIKPAHAGAHDRCLDLPGCADHRGSPGIGQGIAFALADAGFDLVINDLERDADAEATLAGISKRGARASFVAADVADLAAHPGLVDAAFAAFGRLDCLVNNAGVSVQPGRSARRRARELRPLPGHQPARPVLPDPARRAAHGRAGAAPDSPPRSIVSITSVNAEIPSLNRGEYCISKAGASMLTRLFALRLAPHGIGVFEVRPGIIRTPMTAPVAERYEREIARHHPDRPVGRARRRRARGRDHRDRPAAVQRRSGDLRRRRPCQGRF